MTEVPIVMKGLQNLNIKLTISRPNTLSQNESMKDNGL